MTFKEARAEARKKPNGAAIGVYEQESRGWFVEEPSYGKWCGYHPRAVFHVNKDGSLQVVNSTFAKNYQKKYFANMQKKLDKWRPWWYNQR